MYYLGCYHQLHWGHFRVDIHNHIYHICREGKKRYCWHMKMVGLLVVVFGVFAFIAFLSMRMMDLRAYHYLLFIIQFKRELQASLYRDDVKAIISTNSFTKLGLPELQLGIIPEFRGSN
ncbi:hypothetical protein CKAN_01291200 [Cinnamomum micranthum f. kanehirae]|uniref:Uncharacterized protein n=1 Tax=Cinnamomum micranthum f. kanehirae TaxID=337451 RepID=A0A3S3P6E4_9MAGN|nr:hypothetical protein CKAN_01291200 [Cinnamomum micranthum f. kanehirae]